MPVKASKLSRSNSLSTPHRPLELLVHQVRVDHGGPQVGVPEGLLGEADVAGIPEEVSGKGVAQYVRGHTSGVVDARLQGLPLHHLPNVAGVQSPAGFGGKE